MSTVAAFADLHQPNRPAPYAPRISNRFEHDDALIAGLVKETPEGFLHMYCEDMIPVTVQVARISGTVDEVEVLIPVRIASSPSLSLVAGAFLNVYGQVRSGCTETGEPFMFVVAAVASNGSENSPYLNQIRMTGALKTSPTSRTTPLSGRDLSVAILTVLYSDDNISGAAYVPLVFWGKAANEMQKYSKGEIVSVVGRLQSRTYYKTLDNGETYEKTEREVSVSTLIPIERNLATNIGIF